MQCMGVELLAKKLKKIQPYLIPVYDIPQELNRMQFARAGTGQQSVNL